MPLTLFWRKYFAQLSKCYTSPYSVMSVSPMLIKWAGHQSTPFVGKMSLYAYCRKSARVA